MNTTQALQILNIKEESSEVEIKAAYRKMALKHHPDRNQSNKEDAEFKKITEAYNHLKKNNFKRPHSEKVEQTKSEKIVFQILIKECSFEDSTDATC